MHAQRRHRGSQPRTGAVRHPGGAAAGGERGADVGLARRSGLADVAHHIIVTHCEPHFESNSIPWRFYGEQFSKGQAYISGHVIQRILILSLGD